MKKNRPKKEKPYRSAWSNALWSFREMLRGAPQSFWLTAAGVPLAVFLAWAEVRLPALVVSEVVSGRSFAHAALAAQLKDHSLARTYVCIVCGKIKDDSGTIDAPIGRHPTDRKKMAVTQKNSRSAVTHWRVLERFAAYTLVECRLETGRTHQIRVHMAYRGHPILGDMVYGHKKPELGQSSQCLHAKELRFVHPRTGEPVTVSCGLPDYFTALLEKLRAGA